MYGLRRIEDRPHRRDAIEKLSAKSASHVRACEAAAAIAAAMSRSHGVRRHRRGECDRSKQDRCIAYDRLLFDAFNEFAWG